MNLLARTSADRRIRVATPAETQVKLSFAEHRSSESVTRIRRTDSTYVLPVERQIFPMITSRERVLYMLCVLITISAASLGQSADWKARSKLARQAGIGESAPDWLMNSETYVIGYNPGEWDALAQSKIEFITHCPVNRDFFTRCHTLGIRCFPYVTFYQGNANSTYEGVNLKDHPEFIEIDDKGSLKRTGFWESEDAKNMYTTCPNVQAYQDAMVAWVKRILEMGADGVFVDNLSSRAPCFGPKFGKHKHVYADQNHAFAMLLKRVREAVKRYKPDGAVLGNSAYPPSLPHEFWAYLDAEMLESYICTWVSKDRWFDWKTHWNKAGRDMQPFVRAGKQVQALSYLGHTPYGIREDALFCYASARLAGFVWNGGLPISTPETADLYRLRLGRPLTDEREENGVHYRLFQRGLVALNPEKDKPGSISIASPVPTTRLFDLAGETRAAPWTAYQAGGYRIDASVYHAGGKSLACANAAASGGSGAMQSIELNQSAPKPIMVSGWSRADNVSGARDGNYSLYVDAVFTDGTALFGQIAPFSTGTHDWERSTVVIRPEKPVKSLTLYALFRNKSGAVWFDDVSLKQGDDGPELAVNGGFETETRQGTTVDTAATGGKLSIPAFSGRVFLYGSGSDDDLAVKGPRLTVVTSPAMGEVRFRVDGFDYWTHSGAWTTEYVLGPSFGKFDIAFEKPGKHVVEIVDVVPADMKTPKGYGSGERLGQFMDPSNPTKPSAGKQFRFREWQGLGKGMRIEVDVQKDTTITGLFDVTPGK